MLHIAQTDETFTRENLPELQEAQRRTQELAKFIAQRYKDFLELTGEGKNLKATSFRVKDPLSVTEVKNNKGEAVEVFTVTVSWGGDQFGETTTKGHVPTAFVFDDDGSVEKTICAARELMENFSGLGAATRR